MTTKEMRELDAWIGKNIFGIHLLKKKFNNKIHPHGYKLAFWNGEEFPNSNGLHGWGWSGTEDGAWFHVPHYTTDPAAAMAVLEKCCEKMDAPDKYNPGVSPITKSGGQYWVGNQNAEILPLAICLFARQLFSKP